MLCEADTRVFYRLGLVRWFSSDEDAACLCFLFGRFHTFDLFLTVNLYTHFH